MSNKYKTGIKDISELYYNCKLPYSSINNLLFNFNSMLVTSLHSHITIHRQITIDNADLGKLDTE